jgi:hypothetical protein
MGDLLENLAWGAKNGQYCVIGGESLHGSSPFVPHGLCLSHLNLPLSVSASLCVFYPPSKSLSLSLTHCSLGLKKKRKKKERKVKEEEINN